MNATPARQTRAFGFVDPSVERTDSPAFRRLPVRAPAGAGRINGPAVARRGVSWPRSAQTFSSPVARPAGPSVVGSPRPIGAEPWFPAEGGAGACCTRANADCDEVGQRDLADRRPPLSQSGSRSRDAAAVAGGDALAVDSCVTRFLAPLDEPRPRPHRPELVVSCMWQIVGTLPHGRGSRPTLSTLAASTSPLRQPHGGSPRPNGLLFGPEPPSGTSDKNSPS